MMFVACLTFQVSEFAKCSVASGFLTFLEQEKGFAHLGSFFSATLTGVAFGHQNIARTPSNYCSKWKGAKLMPLMLGPPIPPRGEGGYCIRIPYRSLQSYLEARMIPSSGVFCPPPSALPSHFVGVA